MPNLNSFQPGTTPAASSEPKNKLSLSGHRNANQPESAPAAAAPQGWVKAKPSANQPSLEQQAQAAVTDGQQAVAEGALAPDQMQNMLGMGQEEGFAQNELQEQAVPADEDERKDMGLSLPLDIPDPPPLPEGILPLGMDEIIPEVVADLPGALPLPSAIGELLPGSIEDLPGALRLPSAIGELLPGSIEDLPGALPLPPEIGADIGGPASAGPALNPSGLMGDPANFEVSAALANEFSSIIGHYDDAIRLKNSRSSLNKQATALAQQLVGQDPLSPLTTSLSMKTDSEIKDVLAQSIAKVKSHKGADYGKDYASLPGNKQQLVDAMFAGVKTALPGKILSSSDEPITQIEFNGKPFEKVGVVGRGQCGEVLLMQNMKTKEKLVLKGIGRTEDFANEIKTQLTANQKLGSDSLMIKGVLSNDVNVYTLTEVAPNGEYKDQLNGLEQALDSGVINQENALKARLQIGAESAHILNNLQNSGIIHNDIKPNNFIRGEDGKLKIADFGEAIMGKGSFSERVGTPGYMAPEVFDLSKTATAKADQFAYGVMLYESLFNQHPLGHGEQDIQSNVEEYGKGNLSLNLAACENPKLKTMFENLLAVDPNQRPAFSDVEATLKEVAGPPMDPIQLNALNKATSELGKKFKKHQEAALDLLDRTMLPMDQLSRKIVNEELLLGKVLDELGVDPSLDVEEMDITDEEKVKVKNAIADVNTAKDNLQLRLDKEAQSRQDFINLPEIQNLADQLQALIPS